MATLHAFKAVRPKPEFVEHVACVPYDVVNREEARALARGNQDSFLHVIRPDIDLPPTTDEHDDEVYLKGADNLRSLIGSEKWIRDADPCLYIYRLEMLGRTQTGLFGCVSVKDYDNDLILKHEKTRPDKEEDRTKHILAQRAHAEPVMLTYRGIDTINSLVADELEASPLYDFVADDRVQHTLWKVKKTSKFAEAFAGVDHLYVADGHHRCKAASRAAASLRSSTRPAEIPSTSTPPAGIQKESSPSKSKPFASSSSESSPSESKPASSSTEIPEYEFFPAVLFPMEEMEILAYNRIIKQLPVTPEAFLDTLKTKFDIDVDSGEKVPGQRGRVAIYLAGRWHTLRLPEPANDTISKELDVARLSEHLLEPELGISDPRRDPNLEFVGGIRGPEQLERLVDGGQAELAISMFPTSIEELVAVSDAGLLMPPKSTWFEPKLRSGLLVHLFE